MIPILVSNNENNKSNFSSVSPYWLLNSEPGSIFFLFLVTPKILQYIVGFNLLYSKDKIKSRSNLEFTDAPEIRLNLFNISPE